MFPAGSAYCATFLSRALRLDLLDGGGVGGQVRQPGVFVRPVDCVCPDEEEGEEQGARAGLLRGFLLLERLPLYPSAGGHALAISCMHSYLKLGILLVASFITLLYTLPRSSERFLYLELCIVILLFVAVLTLVIALIAAMAVIARGHKKAHGVYKYGENRNQNSVGVSGWLASSTSHCTSTEIGGICHVRQLSDTWHRHCPLLRPVEAVLGVAHPGAVILHYSSSRNGSPSHPPNTEAATINT